MSRTATKTANPAPQDSLLGWTLTQAFVGTLFGGPAFELLQAADMADAIYTDRYARKSQNKAPKPFEMGAKHALSDVFTGARQSLAEMERASFRPAFTPSKQSFSARSFA